jgi:hypothetical protein
MNFGFKKLDFFVFFWRMFFSNFSKKRGGNYVRIFFRQNIFRKKGENSPQKRIKKSTGVRTQERPSYARALK